MTTAPTPDPELTTAKRQYVELFGSALVLNTYLKIALLCQSLVLVGLIALGFWVVHKYTHLNPLVFTVDARGPVAARPYDQFGYIPTDEGNELKHFLTRFVILHYERRPTTIHETLPQSLLFLDKDLADAATSTPAHRAEIEQVLSGTANHVEITVNTVTLSEFRRDAPCMVDNGTWAPRSGDAQLRPPVCRAAIDFTKTVYRAGGARLVERREAHVLQVEFVIRLRVAAELIPVNPLGITITHLRDDQAFR